MKRVVLRIILYTASGDKIIYLWGFVFAVSNGLIVILFDCFVLVTIKQCSHHTIIP
jgi:hypothetical protein